MGSADEIETAGLLRRAAAMLLDALFGLAVVAVGYVVGVLDPAPFSPPADWFWTEWWLRHWLDSPNIFVTPLIVFAVACIGWTAAWEGVSGRTPGDRVLGLRVIGPDGDRPGPIRIALRTIGVVIGFATLGLGWLWIAVSPSRRAWHDLLSGTWVTLDR